MPDIHIIHNAYTFPLLRTIILFMNSNQIIPCSTFIISLELIFHQKWKLNLNTRPYCLLVIQWQLWWCSYHIAVCHRIKNIDKIMNHVATNLLVHLGSKHEVARITHTTPAAVICMVESMGSCYRNLLITPINVCAVRDLLGGASFVSLAGQHTFLLTKLR